jgi:hypothetical protein
VSSRHKFRHLNASRVWCCQQRERQDGDRQVILRKKYLPDRSRRRSHSELTNAEEGPGIIDICASTDWRKNVHRPPSQNMKRLEAGWAVLDLSPYTQYSCSRQSCQAVWTDIVCFLSGRYWSF